jgi:hypothetical protein
MAASHNEKTTPSLFGRNIGDVIFYNAVDIWILAA